MPTLLLMWGIVAFIATLGAHIVVWQFVCPRREMLWLFALFLLSPAIVAIFVAVSGLASMLEVLAIWLMHVALSMAYVQTYPAIREEIPSFRILSAISAAGERGLDRDEVLSLFEGSSLFTDKMSDLDNDGLLRLVNGRLYLTRAGRLLAAIFHRYRRLLGLESGLG